MGREDERDNRDRHSCLLAKSLLARWYALTEVMIRNPAGVGQEIPRAMMGGRSIVPGAATSPPYWRFNRYWRQLYLSSYHVSRQSAAGYVEALRRYGSEWLTGYGSAIAALAESAQAAGVAPCPLRAVIVSGDTLLPAMRSSIERFFECRCFDSYGQSEGVATTMECVHGRMHVLPAVGIVEILREDDGSACAPGEVGEIVATGLLNRAMPLIRYRSGDRAAWAPEDSCPCGAPGPLIEALEGRVDDYLEAADGRRIGRLSTAIKRSPSIHSAQIAQDPPGHAYLLVRPGEGYRHEDALAVQRDLLERIGRFEFEIVEVSEIPKTHTGKMRLVVRLADKSSPARTPYDFLASRAGLQLDRRFMMAATIDAASDKARLAGVRVLVLTSGHEALDGRIYAREAKSLYAMGADVTVVGRLTRGAAGRVRVVPVAPVSSRVARFLLQPWRCVWAARRMKPDIVHFHDARCLPRCPSRSSYGPGASLFTTCTRTFRT